MSLSCRIDSPGFELDKVKSSIEHILRDCELLSLATLHENQPYINTAYFAFDSDLNLVMFTPPTTVHAQNVSNVAKVAAAVYRTDQPVGADLRGLQLFGECHLADASNQDDAFAVYAQRFEWLGQSAASAKEIDGLFESRLYVIRVDMVKIFDEPAFGKEVWVDATVLR